MNFDAWITKYALTRGIKKIRVEDCFDTAREMIKTLGGYPTYFHGKEWHRTKNDAINRAEEMREKKILSLNKQLAKVAGLDFNQ